VTTPTQNAVPKRNELPDEVKWRLEDMYPSDAKWEEDFAQVRELLPSLQSYQGRLTASSQDLLEALGLQETIGRLIDRVFVYARMRRDEDNAVAAHQAMVDRATALLTETASAAAFMVPEILAAEPARITAMLSENPGLALYRHKLENILRHRPHTLTAEMEQLLAQTREMAQGPKTIFNMLANADLKFPTLQDEDGKEVPLTEGRYLHLLRSGDRRVRREAFESLLRTYGKFANTWAAIHSASVKQDVFYARVHKFPSALEASLHADNVPLTVYKGLIEAVHQHLPLLHRYMDVRKRRLGLDRLAMYDLYTPMVSEADHKIPYQEAVKTVEAALHPLGETYLGRLRGGFSNRWIDVLENEGKTSGAYSWGAYGTHPFVLLNYQDNMHDLFTLAHEMGHALHTHFSEANQPYAYADYAIFVAEVASTFNENLLLGYLLGRTTDETERLYLVNHHLEAVRTTVYRQTMFAEFEMVTHEKVEAGEALTPELLNQVYRDLNVMYYGPQVEVGDDIALEWARVPHFYTPFYVYKYATGYAAAAALAQQILREGGPAVRRYLEFLGSGGSDYPISLLRRAGVDMTTSQPVEETLRVFGELVGEMEKATGTPRPG
jgi:oligoendopeptidase F